MHIAVAAAALRGAGSSLVGQQVLSHMLRSGTEDQLTAWIPAQWGPLDRWAGDVDIATRAKLIGSRSGLLQKAWNDLWEIPQVCRSSRADALFSMGDTGTPWPGVPQLLLVHQAYLAVSKLELDFTLSPTFQWRMSLMRRYFRAGIAGVLRFTVQTHFMRARLASTWGIDPLRIDVTPSAPAPEMLLQRCQPERTLVPYFVYLSTAGPHKNHGVLPAVLRRLRDGGLLVRCVLTARERDLPAVSSAAEQLGVRELFEFRGAVSRREAADLIAGAISHVVPSKLESFGLGYLEAMAAGCPVIAADREFARELCGDAALFAPADSPGAFADHIASLVTSSITWCQRSMAARERFNAVSVSWPTIAARYRRLLADLL